MRNLIVSSGRRKLGQKGTGEFINHDIIMTKVKQVILKQALITMKNGKEII